MNSQKISGGTGLLDPEKILKDELQLVPGSWVGDFGCGGAAYFTFETARQVGEGGFVYAVDVLKSVLDNIKRRSKELNLRNIDTLWSNLEKFGACKINNNSLDYGLLINIMFQNKNRAGLLKEVVRMIKAGGKILVIDWKEGRFPIGPRPENRMTLQELVGLADLVGIKLDKKFEAGQYHYGVIFIK